MQSVALRLLSYSSTGAHDETARETAWETTVRESAEDETAQESARAISLAAERKKANTKKSNEKVTRVRRALSLQADLKGVKFQGGMKTLEKLRNFAKDHGLLFTDDTEKANLVLAKQPSSFEEFKLVAEGWTDLSTSGSPI